MEREKYTKKKNRLSYSIMFKLAAVCFAETNGNRATARYLGINEKQIRDWRSKKHHLVQCDANAKRLKGAGRYPVTLKCDFNQKLKEYSYENERNEFMLASRNSTSVMNNLKTVHDEIEMKNRNSRGNIYKEMSPSVTPSNQYKQTGLVLHKGFPEEKVKPKRESDFNERISCALALLDLQTSAKVASAVC